MDLYMEFINDITRVFNETEDTSNIKAVYLGGSLSRGDYVIGISDIDIYIVVDHYEGTELINNYIQEIAKNKLHELLEWCPDGVTVAFTKYSDIKTGCSWLGMGADYYSFLEYGKLMYGKDIREELIEPSKEKIYTISHQILSNLKQIVKQDIKNVEIDKYFIRGVFSTAFSAMFSYICLNSCYLRGKVKIVDEFCKMNKSCSFYATEILQMWKTFCNRELSKEEKNHLISLTKNLVESL